jgi:hypothetical protein
MSTFTTSNVDVEKEITLPLSCLTIAFNQANDLAPDADIDTWSALFERLFNSCNKTVQQE